MKLVLETERLRLVLPGPDTAPLIVRHFVENADYRGRWDPPRPKSFLTVSYWRDRLAEALVEYPRRRSARLVLLHLGANDDDVVGTCNFTQIRSGDCRVGYGLDRRFEGQGYMSEALRAAIPHVFSQFPVRRILANHDPLNVRSARLLERLGFVPDGTERKLEHGKVVVHKRVVLVKPG